MHSDLLDSLQLIVNAVIAAVGVGALLLSRKTLKQVQRQADLIDTQVKDARAAGETNSEIARGSLKAIQTQAEHLGAQVATFEKVALATQRSADAAKLSADISQGISVPALVIHNLGVGNVGYASPEAFFQFPKVRIELKNYGQTAAILKWWGLCFSCEDLPDQPIYTGPAKGMILKKQVVQPNEIYTLPEVYFPYRQEFSISDAKAVAKREKPFHVYGYVCYGDIFGNRLRRLKFCETVLNVFGDEAICDWGEGLAPAAYAGVDEMPSRPF